MKPRSTTGSSGAVRAFSERGNPDAKVVYGGKAYPPAIIQISARPWRGTRCRLGRRDLRRARAGIPAAEMVFHGDNKTADELRYAAERVSA